MRQTELLRFALDSLPGVTFEVSPAMVPVARKLQRDFAKIAGPIFAAFARGLDTISPGAIGECLSQADSLDGIIDDLAPLIKVEGTPGLTGKHALVTVQGELFCRRPTLELAMVARVLHWQIGDFLNPKEQGDLAGSLSLFLSPKG